MKLIYNNGGGFVGNAAGETWQIADKPELGFDYDGIFYNTDNGTAVHLRADGQGPLTAEEMSAVTAYLMAATPPGAVVQSEADQAQGLKLAAENAIQILLDSTAQARGYDSMLALCSYATSTNETFAAEAAAGLQWRDNAWTYADDVLLEIQVGVRNVPTLDQFMAGLPAIAWPNP